MNECAFCEQGVRPFYDLDTKDGGKQAICHTCFHLGKHKLVARPSEPSTTKSQPVASSSSSTATKK